MPLLAWIVLLTAAGGALSALAASSFLLASERVRVRVLPHLVSFATGALLGAALLGLLPHAIEGAGIADTHVIGITLLCGLLTFFVLEKLVLWRHCHADDCETHSGPADPRDRVPRDRPSMLRSSNQAHNLCVRDRHRRSAAAPQADRSSRQKDLRSAYLQR